MTLQNLFSRNILDIEENPFILKNNSIYSIFSSIALNTQISSSSNVLIRQTIVGAGIDYSINNGTSWTSVLFANLPIQIINTNNTVIVVKLTTNITFNNPISNPAGPGGNGYFIIGSSNITFDGNYKTVAINNLNNYLGFIQNGTSSTTGYSNITVQNLGIITSGTTTLNSGAGWIGQKNFSKGALNNLITNCYSIGDITNTGSGGICGDSVGSNGTITIEKCYSIGNITGTNSGGICGSNSSINNGNVSITNCYTRGNITNSNAGGICGSNSGTNNGSCIVSNCYSSGTTSGSNGIFGTNKQSGATQNNCYVANNTWVNSNAVSNLIGTPTYTLGSLSNPIGTVWADINSSANNIPWVFSSYGTSPYTNPTSNINSGQSTQTAIVTTGVTYSLIGISKSPTVPPSAYPTITINSTTGQISTTITSQSGNYTLYIYQLLSTGGYSVSTFALTLTNQIIIYLRTTDIIAYTIENTPVDINLEAIVPPYLKDKINYNIIQNPSHGKSLLKNDIVKYIPDKNYIGNDLFKYNCSYLNFNSNISDVRIKIFKELPDICIKDKCAKCDCIDIDLYHLYGYYGSDFKFIVVNKPEFGALYIDNYYLAYLPYDKKTKQDVMTVKLSSNYFESNTFTISVKNITIKK